MQRTPMLFSQKLFANGSVKQDNCRQGKTSRAKPYVTPFAKNTIRSRYGHAEEFGDSMAQRQELTQQSIEEQIKKSYELATLQLGDFYKKYYQKAADIAKITDITELELQKKCFSAMLNDMPQKLENFLNSNGIILTTGSITTTLLVKKNILFQPMESSPSVFVQFIINEKPNAICMFKLEMLSLENDVKDETDGESRWKVIQTIRIDEKATSGCFAFGVSTESNIFKWNNMYKLRIRGCCASELLLTPFSKISILYVTEHFIDSRVITNDNICALLSFLPSGIKKISLLYRGSSDGFGAHVFHEKCNRKKATVTVVSTTEGHVFGGYTELPWRSRKTARDKGPISDSSAFLFVLESLHTFKSQKYPIKPEYECQAITISAISGPHFGDGDLFISDECNTNTNSTSLLNIYKGPKNALVEATNFKVREIEVYEVF